MTFSGANSLRNCGWAKVRRFLTKARIFSTASSFLRLNGRTTSGTAPLAICWFIESLLRHQWQRACVLSAVLMTTSAPQAEHLKVSTSSVEAMMFCDPEPITIPLRVVMSWLMNRSSAPPWPVHSWRQKAQRSRPEATLRPISVAPQRGHFASPSLADGSVTTILGSPGTWGSPGAPAGGAAAARVGGAPGCPADGATGAPVGGATGAPVG